MLTPATVSGELQDGFNPVIRIARRSFPVQVALMVCLVFAACGGDSTPDQPTAATTNTTQSDALPATATIPTATDEAGSSSGTPFAMATPAAQPAQTPEPEATSTPQSIPTPRPIEQTPPPVRLRIPALGIDTVVQWVGVDAEGRMGVPSNYTDVAWYERGAAPGTLGNAVIAGHLDSKTGPAVFYDLEDLKPGDEIITTSEDGQEFHFIVTTSEVYDADDAPLDRIFGNAIRPHLNLITCDGAFDRSIRQYDKRLVVFTELATTS